MLETRRPNVSVRALAVNPWVAAFRSDRSTRGNATVFEPASGRNRDFDERWVRYCESDYSILLSQEPFPFRFETCFRP